MRALVLSDTHIVRAEDLSLLDSKIRPYVSNVDVIFHAGDLVALDVVDYLKKLKPTYAVAGNMDTPEVRRALTDMRMVHLGGFRIGLAHGRGTPEGLPNRVRGLFRDVDCIIFGHSHCPYVAELSGVLMVNPGSPTEHCFAHRNTLVLLELGTTLEAKVVDLSAEPSEPAGEDKQD